MPLEHDEHHEAHVPQDNPNESDSDSDDSTVPYEDDEALDFQLPTTRSGRVVKEHHPTDYEDLPER